MGRELRRVPPNWKHPKKNNRTWKTEMVYQPMFDEPYIDNITEWIKNHQLWLRGEHPDQKDKDWDTSKYKFYAEYDGGPPDINYYRPDWEKEEMTWYQVYETVSEGTPVSPPFEKPEELIEYLVENGDFWDQKRREEGTSSMPCAPWTRKQAESFVLGTGWAPSGIIANGKFMSGVEGLAELSEQEANGTEQMNYALQCFCGQYNGRIQPPTVFKVGYNDWLCERTIK